MMCCAATLPERTWINFCNTKWFWVCMHFCVVGVELCPHSVSCSKHPVPLARRVYWDMVETNKESAVVLPNVSKSSVVCVSSEWYELSMILVLSWYLVHYNNVIFFLYYSASNFFSSSQQFDLFSVAVVTWVAWHSSPSLPCFPPVVALEDTSGISFVERNWNKRLKFLESQLIIEGFNSFNSPRSFFKYIWNWNWFHVQRCCCCHRSAKRNLKKWRLL